jgi:heterotetrameric sarcosine oxidase gamma subunit
MVELLQARSPLHGLAVPGRFGARGDAAGLIIEERTMALASVTARRGQADALTNAVSKSYNLALPARARRASNGVVAFAGVGPGQWITGMEGIAPTDFIAHLRSSLGTFAAITDQCDSRLILRVTGPRVRDVLAKGVPIDLHRSAFKVDGVAVTLVAHIGVQIDLIDDAPTFQLMAPRSMAGSFWSWLCALAAEFGYDVVMR